MNPATEAAVTWWAAPTPASALPAQLPSPFDELGPHPVVNDAVAAVQAELKQRSFATGKMFGVLVVAAPDGRFGFLRAFSGMLDGHWNVDGFAPPLFDAVARASLEAPGEALVSAWVERGRRHAGSQQWTEAQAILGALQTRQAGELAALARAHATRKELRDAERHRIASNPDLSPAARAAQLDAVDNGSRRDKAERRALEQEQLDQRQRALKPQRRLERRARAFERIQARLSRRLMQQLHDTYRVRNFRGEERTLRSLFAPGAEGAPDREPPSGAGDCCAPKLLAAAQRLGLRPVALAEFWWGPPPPTGGRTQGAFYPACRAKCGPLLPFMLEGLDVAPARRFEVPTRTDQGLDLVYEDAWIVVLNKPHGLLSVPAKDRSITDSVLARLRARHPEASGPLLVHRLDLDTSGLLVAALDRESHANLQRQFADRAVHKRYLAEVEGAVRGERGTIELALRVDLEDRPRQIHDPDHGLSAVTDWEVVERRGERTRLALYPRTGRTHQLRAHVAHPNGLGTPIVGDRLYGHPADRLHLHAEALAFDHPRTGERLTFTSPAPF